MDIARYFVETRSANQFSMRRTWRVWFKNVFLELCMRYFENFHRADTEKILSKVKREHEAGDGPGGIEEVTIVCRATICGRQGFQTKGMELDVL